MFDHFPKGNFSLLVYLCVCNEDKAVAVELSMMGISTGYYPPGKEEVFKEDGPGGDFDFLSQLCTEWEGAATLQDDTNVRTVKIRTGLATLLFLEELLGIYG